MIPDEELYRYGSTESTPWSAIDDDTRCATRSRASSQEALLNSPEPLEPVRISGVAIRSGE